MSDQQIHRRMMSKRLLIISVLLVILGCGLYYVKIYFDPSLASYRSQKSQEAGLQSQITSLQGTISNMSQTIEETGKELVSFSEDKIKYVNLASELSTKYDVTITELSVSDVLSQGQMSMMTTVVEVEGDLEGVRGFISEYCGQNYTNRITKISMRPYGEEQSWTKRYIDELTVLDWYSEAMQEERQLWEEENQEAIRQQQQDILNAGGSVSDVNALNGKRHSLTLDDLFKNYTFRLYLQVDFLGRQ